MASISIYLNFSNQTEEAFTFYKTVFVTEYHAPIMHFRDVPPSEGTPPLAEEVKDLVMHAALPLPGGMMLMGSDAPAAMGFSIHTGNNFYINLMPDTRSETRRLFDALAAGGQVHTALQEMFWGDYHGSLTDRYGIQWMFNCAAKE